MSYYQGDYYQGDGPSIRKIGRWFRKSKAGRAIKTAAGILAPVAAVAVPFAGSATLVGRAAAASRAVKRTGRALRAGGTPGLRSVTQPNPRASADDQVSALTGYAVPVSTEDAYAASRGAATPAPRSRPRRKKRKAKRASARRSTRTTRRKRRKRVRR